ncbi:unnamed protein product [Urochloa humidicola]
MQSTGGRRRRPLSLLLRSWVQFDASVGAGLESYGSGVCGRHRQLRIVRRRRQARSATPTVPDHGGKVRLMHPKTALEEGDESYHVPVGWSRLVLPLWENPLPLRGAREDQPLANQASHLTGSDHGPIPRANQPRHRRGMREPPHAEVSAPPPATAEKPSSNRAGRPCSAGGAELPSTMTHPHEIQTDSSTMAAAKREGKGKRAV